MNDQEAQAPLVFTLFENETRLPEDKQVLEENEDWEQALLRVRERRRVAPHEQQFGEERDAVVSARLNEPVAAAEVAAVETVEMEQILNSARRRKLDIDEQRQVQQAYLYHWQQQHNARQAGFITDPADVFFADDWMKQQNKVHIGRQDVANEHATVWINRNRQTRFAGGQSILDKLVERERQSTASNDTGYKHDAKDVAQRLPEDAIDWQNEAEKIVLLNVYQPNVRSQNPLLCLSEEKLLAQLSEKLRPHLSDALAGMVKTIIQRKQAAMLQDLQQSLMESVPQLVDDVLNHNLARALAALKKEQLARQGNE